MQFDAKMLNNLMRMGPRKAYGFAMLKMGETHDNLCVVCADTMGASSLTEFFKTYPNRSFNVGIAEQNMVGLASGLASEGNNVFISTYACFATQRVYEILKMQVSSMNLNVKVVGVLPGLAAENSGNSHFCLDDFCLMSNLPNFTVLSPCDSAQLCMMVELLSDFAGPAYLRINGAGGGPLISRNPPEVVIGKAQRLTDGADLAIIATGRTVQEALRAGRALKQKGIGSSVYNFHTIKPLDEECLDEIFKNFKAVLTVEEHYFDSGLGSKVAFYKALHDYRGRMACLGAAHKWLEAGDSPYMFKIAGIDAEAVIDCAVRLCRS